MKGGRTAPRNLEGGLWCLSQSARFNEGGADCPPKPLAQGQDRWHQGSFNEGGADCPPKRSARQII